MQSVRQGAIPLFRLAGVQVSLHWSWFLIALYRIQSRGGSYSSILWNVSEYLALFLIVLTHEFGHAMACRHVGGRADYILLWPFGGVAYVNPPQRPGATLWSIAAGPLVNVALAPLRGSQGERLSGMGANFARRQPVSLDCLLHQCRPADIQHSAHLSPGRRPDSTLSSLVRRRPCAQPNGRDRCGVRGTRRVHRRRGPLPQVLARDHLRLPAVQLLGRSSACAASVARGKAAAQAGICLSKLPLRAAYWRLLAVRRMRKGF